MKILIGDVREQLRTLPAESVHCVVTSPPYWGLRQYFFDKASVVRDNLTAEELSYVKAELERRRIMPRVQAT
jgi:DNA modification methylase